MRTRAERQSRKEALLVSVAAGIMGRLGGAARAAALSEGERQAIGRLGARARNRVLSPARRREIARVAAMARWAAGKERAASAKRAGEARGDR